MDGAAGESGAGTRGRGGGWLSSNPDRARAEVFYLLYSPLWMAAVAVVMVGGVLEGWGDAAYTAFGLGAMLPLLVVPALRPTWAGDGRPLRRSYALKFTVSIAIVTFVGSYVFTHFFFDILGMRYGFPRRWHLEARLLGSSDDVVPLFLYPLTQVYFATYYTVMVVGLRRIRRAFGTGLLVTALGVCVLSYAVAFAETLLMANPLMDRWFWYLDRTRMLWAGSVAYALIFLPTLPVVFRIDEAPGDERSLGRVVVETLAASMVAFLLLEAWALVLGPLNG